MAMKKNIAKSIRLDAKTYDYINNYRGNGFNEKFINIINDYKHRQKELEMTNRHLEKDIAERKEMLRKIMKQSDDYRDFFRDATYIVKQLHELRQRVDELTLFDSGEPPDSPEL